MNDWALARRSEIWHLPLLACNHDPSIGCICGFHEAMWRILGDDWAREILVCEPVHLIRNLSSPQRKCFPTLESTFNSIELTFLSTNIAKFDKIDLTCFRCLGWCGFWRRRWVWKGLSPPFCFIASFSCLCCELILTTHKSLRDPIYIWTVIQQFGPIFFAMELSSKKFIWCCWLLMVQINYAFIPLCVYISFLSAYTFRTLFIKLNYMGGYLVIFSLSLSPSSPRKNIISICYQMGVLAVSKRKKNLCRPSGVLVGSTWLTF